MYENCNHEDVCWWWYRHLHLDSTTIVIVITLSSNPPLLLWEMASLWPQCWPQSMQPGSVDLGGSAVGGERSASTLALPRRRAFSYWFVESSCSVFLIRGLFLVVSKTNQKLSYYRNGTALATEGEPGASGNSSLFWCCSGSYGLKWHDTKLERGSVASLTFYFYQSAGG